MSFLSPSHSSRVSSHECEGSDGPSHHMTVDTLEPAPVLDMMTGRTFSQHIPQTKRARSPSSDETDSDINEPVTAPPIIHHLSHFVKHAKSNPKPYKRDGPARSEHRFFNNQLHHNDSMSQEDAEKSKDVLKCCLRRLSPGAAAQAVAMMHTDIEWSEEHFKFLHMVLEDEGEEYTNTSQEPLGTSVQELIRVSEIDIKEQIDCGVAAYSNNIVLFSVGDTQLDYLENTPDDQLKVTDNSNSDDSGIALTNSEEDRFRTTFKLGNPADPNEILWHFRSSVECIRYHVRDAELEDLTTSWDTKDHSQKFPLPPLTARKSLSIRLSGNGYIRFWMADTWVTPNQANFKSSSHSLDSVFQQADTDILQITYTPPSVTVMPSATLTIFKSMQDPVQVITIMMATQNPRQRRLWIGAASPAVWSWFPILCRSICSELIQHGNYLMPSGSSQQGVQTMLLVSFPGHHVDGHYDGSHNYDSNLNVTTWCPQVAASRDTMRMAITTGGHNYNFTVSHGMNNPPPLPDTHHSVVSHSSNNSQPAMSNDIYYFMRFNNSNLQAPLDPIPEVTRKLIHGRHTSRKTKTAASTQTKFLKSKYVTQESPLSTEHVSSLFVFLTPTLLQDFKGDVQTDMFKKLFKDNLFPSPTELSTIANDTLDATIVCYTTQNTDHGHELTHWKSGSDAKKLLTRLKGVLKKIHGNFEEITSISWISAYDLSLDLSLSRDEMQAVRVANMTSLLSDFLFADKIVESWIPPLTNAIALAVTSRAWSLKKALAGPWSATFDLGSEENKVYYISTKSRLCMLPEDEHLRFDTLLINMCRALW
ncbi:uncharacterized protein EDB93DRAFT_1099854 [Suillus bovinus]|uniref:uncharacterized protein n=1 Tax=Suillus bovinus TaxID=48563 RepID=UPI001B884003|nr:uncharacterized protein EDB93DRAFT_1099854 [Suillus bovinus]KAG2159499.1 hypothetical protein EDB93DRAFT_1099854 [Suillus bovinus]